MNSVAVFTEGSSATHKVKQLRTFMWYTRYSAWHNYSVLLFFCGPLGCSSGAAGFKCLSQEHLDNIVVLKTKNFFPSCSSVDLVVGGRQPSGSLMLTVRWKKFTFEQVCEFRIFCCQASGKQTSKIHIHVSIFIQISFLGIYVSQCPYNHIAKSFKN